MRLYFIGFINRVKIMKNPFKPLLPFRFVSHYFSFTFFHSFPPARNDNAEEDAETTGGHGEAAQQNVPREEENEEGI